jgi:hypothetical protein
VALLIGRLVDSAATARKIGQCQRRVIGTPGYFEAKGLPQTPADLLAHQAIDHPITAPGYSERRSTMAKRIGLGRKPQEAVASTPEVIAASPKRRGRKPRSAAAE